jgi:hypothetical protein
MGIKKSFVGAMLVMTAIAVFPLNHIASWMVGYASPAAAMEIAAVAAAPAGPAGAFEGEYVSGGSGAAGKLRIQLREEGGKWSAQVSAAYNGADLPCKVVNVEVKDSKLVLTFSTEVEGGGLQVALNGTLTGDNWSGTYEATAMSNGSPMDSGSWKASRKN